MSQNTDPLVENRRLEYEQVCNSHRAISDFRAKLLTLLPLASGTGIFLLLNKQAERPDSADLAAIGLFGFVVTLGLFFHELRGISQCGGLIKLGKELEEQLGLGEGQFTLDYAYYNPTGRYKAVIWLFHETIGPVGAAWIIYPAVCVGWLYVAAVGLNVSLACLLIPILIVLFFGACFWGATRRWKGRAGSGETQLKKK